jgi:hypothetical protein
MEANSNHPKEQRETNHLVVQVVRLCDKDQFDSY